MVDASSTNTPPEGVPPVIVFDVNETLLDITVLEPLFARLFGNGDMMREWFAQLILYSQTMTLSELYTPFSALAAGALRMTGTIHGVAIGEEDIAELKTHLGNMPAHPDAAPALERLRAAGLRLVTLTNSPPSPSPTPLEKAGLAQYFEQSFSVDTVGKFKPAPQTYQHVAQAMNVPARDLCLVACHLWDTIGAQAAGCKGAFVSRPYNAFLPADGVPEPDYTALDLGRLVDLILKDAG
ncbi:haloacid dehalogenase type II [Profundibacterium mesophilum]|uniref:(S)-2-haloacid dehalogenase n=1 Tax=Profundibacterium mesophilum KAUST100406-0324 TaxID=1037889 RepID=A0A921TB90_9RHOB|nr:haloacid dehalogenase type II [Profundibacterium mesophilum]KAF0675105.1 2-haloacid dehalogenase [Profundibacterium mesophilum KAUST100406-0324]